LTKKKTEVGRGRQEIIRNSKNIIKNYKNLRIIFSNYHASAYMKIKSANKYPTITYENMIHKSNKQL